MAVNNVNYNDSLREGTDKINQSIDQSNQAIDKANSADAKADNAVNTSQAAETKADSVQEQFNQVVIDGDSSPMISQALAGTPYTTLREKHEAVDTQLAENTLELNKAKVKPSAQKLQLGAHRGFAALVPENTMSAFSKAISLGAYALEADIQISSDGHAVVIHDSTVDRTTDGTGAVSSLTLAQLQLYDAGSYYHPKFATTRIPTYEQFLDYASGNAKEIYPEIKGYRTINDIPLFIDPIIQRKLEDITIIQCADLSVLSSVRNLSKKIRFAYVKGDEPTASELDTLEADGLGYIMIDHRVLLSTPSIVSDCYNRGIGVMAWTVNDIPSMSQLLKIGVYKIVSDYYWGGGY